MENGEKTENKDKKRSMFKISVIIVVVALGIGSVVGFTFLNEQQKMKSVVNVDTIYDNIYINDIDVGGLTKEDALKKVNESYVPTYTDQKVIVKCQEESMEINYNDLNPTFDFTAAVDEAYLYAREGSLSERYNQIVALETTPKKITYNPTLTYEEDAVTSQIASFAEKFDAEPVSATMAMENGKFVVTPEQIGYQANVEATEQAVLKLISENTGGTVELVLDEVPPQIVASDFDNSKSLIGSYTTTFSGSIEEARNINIQTATDKINGYVINPGETFSTNDAFGEMTYDNGYRNATVIQGGQFVDGMGGGVCQVSSTLYNAILYAELPIVERQNHSLKVGYVDWGFDATLAGDYIDLKFMNDTEYPVIIESYLENNKVIVNLYGYEIHEPGRTLSFSNALVSSTPPGAEEIIQDPNLPDGERVVEKNGKNGYTYDVYKTIYQDDKEVETVHVNTSYYKPTKATVRVGTGAAVAEVPAVTTSPTEATETPETTETTETTETPDPEETPDPVATPPTIEETPETTPDVEPSDAPLLITDYPTVLPPSENPTTDGSAQLNQ